MISLKNIFTISKYEGKVLWRNWFFRIVALAGVIFVTILNIAVFSGLDNTRWLSISNNHIIPYATLVMISIPQVAAVIFLATGLIKKDKKIDTNEVFFVRPITNLDYVFGKALAIFKLFFILNMVLLSIAFVVNIINGNAELNPAAYFLYPFLTSVPSIIFTTGLAFLLVTLIRNQPITIVLLLGLAAVQLFKYFDKFANILDFSAFRLSMLISEISGFADMKFALNQRLFYTLVGIACMWLTAFFLDRLPSYRRVKVVTGIVGLVLVAASALSMVNLWAIRSHELTHRAAMVTINYKWAKTPNVDITAASIDLEHRGDQIYCTANLTIKNNSGAQLDSIYFTLNPGLIVDQLSIGNDDIKALRDDYLVSINQGVKISNGATRKVQIKYHGTIQDEAAHLEVDDERYESPVQYLMYSLQKKYAFLQPDYALLTSDVMWYPGTEIGYSHKAIAQQKANFIDFELYVKTQNGLTAISQGDVTSSEGNYHFKPEYPLPQISLAIGNYVKKGITLDSVTYAIYHYPNHNFLENNLGALSDTLSYLIDDIVSSYEDVRKLKYPFKRLQFVEAPIHFMAYAKIYESSQAFVQPEMVFWPEEGGDLDRFDFRRQLRDLEHQARQDNQVYDDKQKQAYLFKNLISHVFTKVSNEGWFFAGRNADDPDYSIFPNYYSFNSAVISKEWPLLNRGIAKYIGSEGEGGYDYSRDMNGISFIEECNQLMREAGLQKIIANEPFSKIKQSVSLKSEYLFAYLGQIIGENQLKSFLYNWVNTHQHQPVTYETLRSALIEQFQVDITPIIKKVYQSTSQPAFDIFNVEKYEVVDGDKKRYQVIIDVKNVGENDGILEVIFNHFDDKKENDSDEPKPEEKTGKLAIIKKGEIKRLGYILDERPNEIKFNTIISRNIPSEIYMSVGELDKMKHQKLFEGEQVLANVPQPDQYQVIVDNEDSLSFTTFSPIKPTYLRAFLDNRDDSNQKYFGQWHRSYAKWLPTTGTDFYGSVIRSAHFTRAGSGEKTATWAPTFKEPGFYDIYIYLRGKNQKDYQPSGQQSHYRYIIHHADGEDDIKYNLANAEPGWNYLGSYYFNASGGSVELSDDCELRTVYADAIKWVKQ
ncbi:golvesin C-terminal-like domain-containing protein [Fulvivirga ligni]|uniref:golvesin C-terminal-like domain-containing protein n=1 Tax=Fulvivirga ligni TaxID=2904246 RepID=UPI001F46A832|nr:hypothetical protein [Fulvivirga ligni]UII19424.1 hypothetical protein LVD16_16415 [Fulvivirga ligni]